MAATMYLLVTWGQRNMIDNTDKSPLKKIIVANVLANSCY